ncbi:MAG: hypothetical protein ACTMIZ_03740, partial [Cellulosimicrobium funkei]
GFAEPDWGRVNAPKPPPRTPSTPEGGQDGGDQGGQQPGGDEPDDDQPDSEADGRGDRGDRSNGAGRESDLGAWLEGLGGGGNG